MQHWVKPKRLAIALNIAFGGLLSGNTAWAGDFSAGGIDGRWSMTITTGTSVRTREADPELISVGNGGKAANANLDDGNLNFKKGDAFSTTTKVIGELELKRDNVGVFMRAKALRDHTLENAKVYHGHAANGYQPNAKLNDSKFDNLSQFTHVSVLDAYAFANTNIKGKDLQIKLGNQVVTWGEALFIQGGISQFGTFDATATRRPDVQLKEVFLPLPQITANMGFGNGLSIEGFYQLKYKRTIVDGCGTLFSQADILNCGNEALINPGSVRLGPNNTEIANFDNRTDQQLYQGTTPDGPNGIAVPLQNSPLNFRVQQLANREAKDSGQFGVAARYFIQSIGTDIALYHVNYHQRIPALGLIRQNSNIPGSFWGGSNPLNVIPGQERFPLSYYFDYNKENIKVTALSAATEVKGFSVFGELSYTQGLPVAYNSVDFVKGVASGVGPLASLNSQGGFIRGYDVKNKTQLQFGTIKSFPRVLKAESVALVAEFGYQRWQGIGDPQNSTRYGRAVTFGFGQTDSIPCDQTGNPNASTCEAKGYATPTAYGYRALLAFSYPNAFAGVNLRPRIFFSHDIKGYSGDGIFLENRKALGLGVRADYLSQYFVDASYNRFGRDAKFDPFRDRDFASIVLGVNF